MRACTVRIIKCDEPLAWYADKIGETFDSYNSDDVLWGDITLEPTYTLAEDYDALLDWPRLIQKRDCELCAEPSDIEHDAHGEEEA